MINVLGAAIGLARTILLNSLVNDYKFLADGREMVFR